jgi:hypothetical protein
MTNKPNLYVFAIDISGSMTDYIEQINRYIEAFVENKKSENNYIGVILFNLETTFDKVFELNNFDWKLTNQYIDGGEDIVLAIQEIDIIIREYQQEYLVQEAILITDVSSNKENIRQIKFKGIFEDVELYDITIPIFIVKNEIKQPILNSLRVKIMSSFFVKLFLGISFIISISFVFYIKIDNVNIFPIFQKKEKELDRKTQPIINNIVQNTNITIINVFNQFKIDIKPTINFNFNFDTKINNQVNFHINIPYSSIDSSLIFRHKIENYELGKYNIRDSLITTLIRRLVENKDINNYYLSSKNAKLKIIGETDSVRITGIIRYKKPESLPYVDINKIVFVNGKEQSITIRQWQQIKENYELGFLRAYFIGEFLKQKVDLFQSKSPEIEYHSKTNCCIKGGKYRTTEIELIIYDVQIPNM